MNEEPRGHEALWYLSRLTVRRRRETILENDREALATVVRGAVFLLLAWANHSMFVFVFGMLDALPVAVAPELLLASSLLPGAVVGLMVGLMRANDALYLGAHVEMLLSLPVDTRWVMLTKTVWTWPYVLGIYMIIAFPPGLAYARILGIWPVMPIYLLAVPVSSLVCAAAAVLCLVVVGQVATSNRLREALGIIATVGVLIFYYLWFSVQGDASVQVAGEALVDIVNRVGDRLVAPWILPITWPAVSLRLINTGQPLAGWAALTAALVLSCLAVWFLSRSQAGLYTQSLTLTSALSSRPRRRRERRRPGLLLVHRSPLGALLWRDWIIMRRNPRLWQNLVLPAGWVGLMLLQTWRQGTGFISPLGWSCLAAGMAGYVASQLAPLSFAFEQQSVYQVATLPVPSRLRVLSKLLAFGAPPAGLGMLMVSAVHYSSGSLQNMLPAVFLIAAASGVGTAFGLQSAAEHTDFAAARPWEQGTAAGCTYALVTAIVLGLGYGALMLLITAGEYIGLSQLVNETVSALLLGAAVVFFVVPYQLRMASSALRMRLSGAPRSGAQKR